MLVVEATYLNSDSDLAAAHAHMTAAQAAKVAAECGVRRLVLTHFSQRYEDLSPFGDEAARYFHGDVVVAHDLARIGVPRRR